MGYTLIGVIIGFLIGVTISHFAPGINSALSILASIIICALTGTMFAANMNSKDTRSTKIVATEGQIDAIAERVEYHFGKTAAGWVKNVLEKNTAR